MARTLTSNLKLRVDSNLTSDSKFNLNRIDDLGSIYQTDSNQNAVIRSQRDINITPNSADINGTGVGGTVNIGTADQIISQLNIFASSFSVTGGGLGLSDQAAGGTQKLTLEYRSDISGTTNITADRTLSLDLESLDRSLTLGLDLSLSGEDLSLVLPSPVSWTLPADSNGLSGQVLTTDGAGILSWSDATASTLGALTDVDTTGALNDDVIRFNSTSGAWEASAISSNVGQIASFDWVPLEGASKTIVHNFGTQKVLVEILDTGNNYRRIDIPDTARTDINTVQINSTSGPVSSNWVVLLHSIP